MSARVRFYVFSRLPGQSPAYLLAVAARKSEIAHEQAPGGG